MNIPTPFLEDWDRIFLTIIITVIFFFQKKWKNISDINIFLCVVATVFPNVELSISLWVPSIPGNLIKPGSLEESKNTT